MSDKRVIVNSVASREGGALTILRQFIDKIPRNGTKWLIFTSDRVELSSPNPDVRIEKIAGTSSLVKRVAWDTFGLSRWLRRHGIEPQGCISLQNTGFRAGRRGIPHFIYYHQSIPFYPGRWNPLKREQRTLAFYKYLYPFFVKLFLRKGTTVYVQLEYLREAFSIRYRHPLSQVKAFFPEVQPIGELATGAEPDRESAIKLFYPADYYPYKNHRTLFEAVEPLDGVQLIVTIPSEHEGGNLLATGRLPYSEVLRQYRKVDGLVFPSTIEAAPLPLVEGAMCGLPIIASDMPFARQMLQGYEGAVFVPATDPDRWREAILRLRKGERFIPLDLSDRPGWPELFADIMKRITN